MIFHIQTYEGDVSDLELTFSWDVDNMGKVRTVHTDILCVQHTYTSKHSHWTYRQIWIPYKVLYTGGQTYGMMIGLSQN